MSFLSIKNHVKAFWWRCQRASEQNTRCCLVEEQPSRSVKN